MSSYQLITTYVEYYKLFFICIAKLNLYTMYAYIHINEFISIYFLISFQAFIFFFSFHYEWFVAFT